MKYHVKEQMSRYPVFSCSDIGIPEQFELFKDESLQSGQKKNLFNSQFPPKKRNQKIISIYNKITNTNYRDPFYPIKTESKKNLADIDSYGSPVQSSRNQTKKNNQRTVERFVGELLDNLQKNKQDGQTSDSKICDFRSHQEKINLLKRIIQHYNVKTKTLDYHSNLIRNIGLKVDMFDNVSSIVVKKNLHPRVPGRLGSRTAQDNKRSLLGSKTIQPKGVLNGKNIPYIVCQDYNNQNEEQQLQYQKLDIEPNDIKYETINQSELDNIQTKNKIRIQKKSKRTIPKNQNLYSSFQNSKRLLHKPFKRNSNENDSLDMKLKKYREFLFVLNFSNHLYRELEIQKYQQPFKYYVGKGNNGNLIKSVMNHRFWFQLTTDYKEADFIWTQIKVQAVYTKQISTKQLRKQQSRQITSNQNNSFIQSSPSKQFKPNFKRGHSLNRTQDILIKSFNSTSKKGTRKHEPQNPLQKIVSYETSVEYQLILNYTIRKNQHFSDRKKFIKKQFATIRTEKDIIHNHLPFNGYLGNKKAMFYCLREYYKLINKNIFQVVPETYHIKKGIKDEEYKNFANVFLEKKKRKESNVWILKPGEFSNRGQGITCTSKLEDIRKRVIKCKNGLKTTSLIIQSYILNPLLYNQRKFDIRAFMLITSHNGKIKGYWYQEGYIRTASSAWSIGQLEDSFVHLTNDAIQKNGDEYGRFQPGNKLSYTQLQRYLQTLPKNGRNMDFFSEIYPKMRNIAAETIKSTYFFMDPQRYNNNFQIFGLDFMIDDRLKPWLIEVNTNPCLQLSSPLLQRIIPYMVQNAFRISVDTQFPPPSNVNAMYRFKIPQNSIHYNKFQLIFDEDRDGQLLSEMYKNSKLQQYIDDIEEDKQQYQQQGNMLEIQNI